MSHLLIEAGDFSFYLRSPKGKLSWTQEGEKLFIDVLLEDPPNETEGPPTELIGYFTKDSKNELLVNEEKATLFSLGDLVEIVTPLGKLTLQFSLKEGSGGFKGFSLFGNRPGMKKTENPYAVFDQILAVRTLSRSTPAVLHIDLLLNLNGPCRIV